MHVHGSQFLNFIVFSEDGGIVLIEKSVES